jgi:hypothetical protein
MCLIVLKRSGAPERRKIASQAIEIKPCRRKLARASPNVAAARSAFPDRSIADMKPLCRPATPRPASPLFRCARQSV